jgi:hypothetical protein
VSPAVNVDLEEVPFAILELVKARILANRRRLLQGQQGKPRPSTRPGAQFRKVGASSKEWRKPQYGAGVFGSLYEVAIAIWTDEFITNEDGDRVVARRLTIRNAANTDQVVITVPMPVTETPSGWVNGETVIGDPFLDPNPGVTTITKNSVRIYRDNKAIFCLPAGKDRSVFVFAIKAISVDQYATFTYEFSSARSGNFRSAQWSSSVDIQQVGPSEIDTMVCVLVSDQTVKQISAPAGLRGQLNRMLQHPSTYPVIDYHIGVLGRTGYVVEEFRYDESTETIDWHINEGESTELENISVQGIDQNPPRPSTFYDYYAPTILISTYGIGDLVSTYHPAAGAAFYYSPGIFSFLNDFDQTQLESGDYFDIYEPDGFYDQHHTYGYIRNNYLADAPLPRHFLAPCVRSSSCPVNNTAGINYDNAEDSYITFDKTSSQPESAYEPMDPLTFSKGTKKVSLANAPHDDIISGSAKISFVWDWGNPSYCRQQLLALGFTEIDLTP